LEKKEYDWSVDVWCLGILTYELLIGHAPFESQDRQKVMEGIINVNNVLFRSIKLNFRGWVVCRTRRRSLSRRFYKKTRRIDPR
jgi:serine/threonine protein kinase